jgi:hypothetical protein
VDGSSLPGGSSQKVMPDDVHGMCTETEHLVKATAQTKSADDRVNLVDANEGDTDARSAVRPTLQGEEARRIEVRLEYSRLASTIKPEDAFQPLD